mmetsp:Transcript_39626/g.119757  ORF Transcript_39626/g.119757 Transcript_39626/m.119757 type:complete len:249 (-) Transcript_39626:232-978(-)
MDACSSHCSLPSSDARSSNARCSSGSPQNAANSVTTLLLGLPMMSTTWASTSRNVVGHAKGKSWVMLSSIGSIANGVSSGLFSKAPKSSTHSELFVGKTPMVSPVLYSIAVPLRSSTTSTTLPASGFCDNSRTFTTFTNSDDSCSCEMRVLRRTSWGRAGRVSSFLWASGPHAMRQALLPASLCASSVLPAGATCCCAGACTPNKVFIHSSKALSESFEASPKPKGTSSKREPPISANRASTVLAKLL